MTDHVLVAYDGTPQSEKALEFAVDEWGGKSITLLYVINPVEGGYGSAAGIPSGAESWYENAKEEARELLDEAVADHEGLDIRGETTVGRPAQAIVEFVEDGDYDHLVVGSHGRTGVSRILLGSTAEKVVREAPVPTTVVR